MAGRTATLSVKIVGDASGASKAFGEVDSGLGKTQSAVKKMAVPAAAAFAAVTAAAVGFAQAAVEDAAGAQRMAGNLAKSTGATQDQVDATEDWISAQGRALGVADDQLRPAMERLARSTGDLGEAQQLAALSMDISAATGKDLETVSNAVAKANDGQMGALKKLGLTVGAQAENNADYIKAQEKLTRVQRDAQVAYDEFGPKSKEYASAMGKVEDATADVSAIADQGIDWVGELGDQMGGAAASQAGTAAGKMQRFQLALSETGEAIGAALLPALEALLPLLLGFASWAQDNSTALAIVGGIVGGLAAAVLVANAAMAAWSTIVAVWSAVTAVATGVGAAFGAVMAVITSPITLIILAVVALIAVVVLLWKNWDKVTKALVTAFNWVKGALAAAFNAIRNNIKTIMLAVVSAIFPFIGVGLLVVKNWETIKATLARVWAAIKSAVSGAFDGMTSAVRNAVGDVVDIVSGLPDKILTAIGNLSRLLYDKGRQLIQGLIDGIKSIAGSVGRIVSGIIPGGNAATATLTPMPAVRTTTTASGTATTSAGTGAVQVTEEQIYRAIYRLIMQGDARNGRRVLVG